MNAVLAVVRGVHFASTLLVFGELVFAIFVAVPARAEPSGVDLPWRRARVVALWSLAASLASWLGWLVCTASQMSGMPVAEAMSWGTLALVLGRTGFGHVWLLRVVLAAILALLLARSSTLVARCTALAVAGAYAAGLAWAGHAVASEGAERDIQVAADAVHLLAAGAWLGALPGLIAVLGRIESPSAAVQIARRFSTLGVASVCALLLTGFVNAWHLVGNVPALLGTDYGRLLLAKLALFAAMLALAATNRTVLTPRLVRGYGSARLRLRRNALLETAAGVGVIAIVGVLGITVPGAHQNPVWPFSRGLDLEPAYPSSYALSPVPYTTGAIARGAVFYAENCSACHGPFGHGDGPASASLPKRPANLAEHGSGHREGDLFWWIAHGIAGTPMPSFDGSLDDTDIWTLVQFVRALSGAEAARTMTGTRAPAEPIVAPDFEFETAGRAQESLARHTGGATLLVFYSLPQSLPRLRALEAQAQRYAAQGARVIAVAMQPELDATPFNYPMRVTTGTDTPIAYAMFARGRGYEDKAPTHVEFLIDGAGYLRRRWLGVPNDPDRQTAEILDALTTLGREPLPAPPRTHAH
ncbi:MAG TPA: copper homeostasis membrane protein CopD [Casimicrobiaceae bacterium]